MALANAASAAVALSVGNNQSSTTFSGALSGSGSLTKIGAGTLVLSGSNSYGGGTNVEAGTLAINTGAALPEGTSLTVGGGRDVHLRSVAGRVAGGWLGIGGVGRARTGNPGPAHRRADYGIRSLAAEKKLRQSATENYPATVAVRTP